MTRGLLLSGIAATLTVGITQTHASDTGDELLKDGMRGRVSAFSDGVDISRVDGLPDAGYFIVRLIDQQASEAAICPERAFKRTQQGKRWRELNKSVFDVVFKRQGLWGLNASFAISNPAGQPTVQEVRMIAVKNPQARGCVPQVLGSGVDGTPSRFLFITPINVNDNIYGSEMVVNLRSVHQYEADKARIDNLWGGLGLFAKIVSAPLAPIVDALSGEGKKEINQALTEVAGEAGTTLQFKANPDGAKTPSNFVYLGFESFGQTDPNTLRGGVTLRGDYQASVLLPPVRYFSQIANVPLPEKVLAATPLKSDSGAPQTLRDRLGSKAFGLADQVTPGSFSGACVTLRPDLLALGLSEVDADLWLWAMARTNSHSEVSGNLDAIDCFGKLARGNLKRVGNIVISRPPPMTEPAKFEQMQKAMENLGFMTRQGTVNSDLMGRFADKIDVSIADDGLSAAAGSLPGGGRDRTAVLDFMVKTFSRYGCYLPRNDVTNYQLRPFMPLRLNGRAGAMMMHGKDDVPYVVTFGFDGMEKGATDPKALVSAIGIQKQGDDTGDIVRDLAAGNSEICPKL